jgi:uric acid transporter
MDDRSRRGNSAPSRIDSEARCVGHGGALFVLGGAGIVMFGMVAATGIRIFASVEYKTNRNNLFIVAISMGFEMIPLVAPTFFATLPRSLEPLLNSRIVLAAVAAVLLNVYFNGATSAGSPEVHAEG